MHYQFLIEDASGKVLVEHIMTKIQKDNSDVTYDIKAFKGIGGLKVSGNANKVKTDKLLNDLKIYLKGFDRSLQGISAVLFIVLDNDKRETEKFRKQLEHQAELAGISTDYVFSIAVEEMEAWLLGDREAIVKAYPQIRLSLLKEYEQDSICGTWEVMANAIYKGGMKVFARDCPTYREVGKYKSEWADKIGKYMNIDNNLSPSFNQFILEIKKRLVVA